MKKEPILYGVIGLLIGIILTGFVAGYSVNHGYNGMMQMMGVNNHHMNSSNVDKQFIEQMIPHHESAIAMAKLALQKTKHDEVKTLANNIITSQTAEINTMKQWYKDWYGTDVPTVSANHMWGGGMMNSQTNTDELSAASDFDKAFLSQMIEHHQMAVMMANMLNISTNRSEMKKLGNDIITAQNKEIGDMQKWQQQWGYETSTSDTGDMMNMMGH
jgi:uncharacterized protein (DUF305 family)